MALRFTCQRSELSSAVMNTAKAVSPKSTIPALEGLKLSLSCNELELTGYDLELGIRACIAVESEDCGELVLNSHLFSEIVRNLPDGLLSFEMDDQMLIKISVGITSYQISAMSAEEYPDLPELQQEIPITLSQAVLKEMIQQTVYAVAQNEHKPVLRGELFDFSGGTLRLVASDGFRIAMRTEQTDVEEDASFVVPAKALNEVARLLKDDENKPCQISATRAYISFEIGGCQVFSRLLEGDFINYQNSIPTEFRTEVQLKTRELCSCLERCSLLINEKNKAPVKLIFENGRLSIHCKTGLGSVDDSIDVKLSGEALKIGFNNRYLLDAARNAGTDLLRLQFNGSNRVVRIVPPEGESFQYLIMPIMLKA